MNLKITSRITFFIAESEVTTGESVPREDGDKIFQVIEHGQVCMDLRSHEW